MALAHNYKLAVVTLLIVIVFSFEGIKFRDFFSDVAFDTLSIDHPQARSFTAWTLPNTGTNYIQGFDSVDSTNPSSKNLTSAVK